MAGEAGLSKGETGKQMEFNQVIGKVERSKSQRLRSCVLVLGMDDPGTSAMVDVLGNIGCQAPLSAVAVSAGAGATIGRSRIHDFNDELLASAGSSRDDFTPFYQEWLQSPRAPEFFDRALALLDEEFGNADLFLLSDPSISPLLPFWTEALDRFGCAPKAVIVVRNPVELGRLPDAVQNRNEPLSQMVWLRYMLAAEHGTRQMPRFYVGFEELVQSWEEVVGQAQKALQLVWPKPVASIEFDVAAVLEKVRNRDDTAPPPTSVLLPPWLHETYEILSRWAKTGITVSDYAALDRIRGEFDVAANAFARVIRGTRASGLERTPATRRVTATRSVLHGPATTVDPTAHASDAATLKVMLQDQRRKTTLLNAELEKQVEATELLESRLIEAQAEIEASRARRKEMARVIANREAKIARVYEELAAMERHVIQSEPLAQIKTAAKRMGRTVGRLARKAAPDARSVR
jgi:hypothetical protein